MTKTMRKNTDARARGGVAHSSDESLVTREERRGSVIQSEEVANPQAGMSGRNPTKPYVIARRAVWEAYQQVKANRGAAGIDEETIAMFEQNLSRNLYKLWNRMSSGSYFPPPVKQVEIPKKKGGTRKLGVPTVADRIAQTVVKQIIEPKLDAMFHPDSYGYRPSKSAKQAIAVTRKRCWQYDWVVEFAIKTAFDQIDHLLMKAVREIYARLCVQRRLACSVGTKPTEAKVRSLVAWIAERRETKFLKPIDATIFGMMASHRAVTKVNAEGAAYPHSHLRGLEGYRCAR